MEAPLHQSLIAWGSYFYSRQVFPVFYRHSACLTGLGNKTAKNKPGHLLWQCRASWPVFRLGFFKWLLLKLPSF